MTKRRWVLVEDLEEKVRAYLDAFISWPGRGDDSMHVLFFPAARGFTVERVYPANPESLTHETVCDIVDLSAAVARLVNVSDPLIILLDVVLMVYGENIQDKENIANIWRPLDNRPGDDLIFMVTSAEASSMIVSVAVPRKGKDSVGEVTGDTHATKVTKAQRAIEAASQEWTDRYDLPGKKILHTLMCAGKWGQGRGHINNYDDDVPPGDFLLREAFSTSENKVSSFKALFHYAPEERVRDYECELGILAQLLKLCGIPSQTDAGFDGSCAFLPVSPGAVFIVHLCRLIRLLNDPKCKNPVTQVRVSSKNKAMSIALEFKESITKLKEAYNESKNSATVRVLNSMIACCLPITPAEDATMEKTFERAMLSNPMPNKEYAEFVRNQMPLPITSGSKNVLEYSWKDKELNIITIID